MQKIWIIGFCLTLLVIFGNPVYADESSTKVVEAASTGISTDVLEQLDFANGLFQRGIYEMSMNEYQNFIEAFPESQHLHEAYFGIGESLFFLKSYEKAIKAYKQYTTLFPEGEKASASSLRSGQSFLLMDNYDEALSLLLKVKEGGLDNNFKQCLYFYLGKCYKKKAQKDKAVECFRKASEVLTGNEYSVHSYLELGDLLCAESKLKEALECYEKAFNSTSAKDKKSLALYKRGEAQLSAGDYTSAACSFKDLLEKYPDTEVARDTLTNLLLAFFNLSKYVDIISEYQNNSGLIRQDGTCFRIHYITVTAYSELSRHEEALSLLNKILSIDSLSGENRRNAIMKKIEILIKLKRLDEALSLSEAGLKDFQDGKDRIYMLKAEAYYGALDYLNSYKFYTKVFEEFPDSSFAGEALYGAAHALKSPGDNKKAMDLFFRYFNEGKDISRQRKALYNEILIAADLSIDERAIAHSEIYLTNFPDWYRSEGVLFRLGSLYSKMKKFDKAADVFKRFIGQYEKSDKLQEACFFLAYNLQLAGNTEEALNYYAKIVEDKEKSGEGGELYYSVLKNMAVIYLNKKEENKVGEIYNNIINGFEKNDLNIETYLWLTGRYSEDKKFEDMLRVLQKAEIKDEGKQAVEDIAYFRAIAYAGIQNFEEAVRHYDIVLLLNSEGQYSGAARIGKGSCLIETGALDIALTEFEAAVKENPDDNTIAMRARFEMANVENLRGNLEKSYKLYLLVAVLYDDENYCPQALFKAGEISESLRKKEEAAMAYQEIIERYEQSNLSEQAKERLRLLSEK